MNAGKKKIIFIGQAKGGVGKTFLTSLFLFQKHFFQDSNNQIKKTVFFDLDSVNKTLYNRFSNRFNDVKYFSIYNDKFIYYDIYYSFFETIAESDYEEIYCDLGSIESYEILKFFNDETFIDFLSELNFEVTFITVFRLYHDNSDCLNYFRKVVQSTPDVIKKVCMLNGFNINKFNQRQLKDVNELNKECSEIGKDLIFKKFGFSLELEHQDKIDEYVSIGFNKEIEFYLKVTMLGIIEEINMG